jgi:ABC-2 type transport system ATP-binding protein
VTALLTTHNIEEADQLCERIAIMDHGKILVLDTSDQLKKIIPGGTRLELRLRIPELVASGTATLPRESTVKTQLLDTLRAMPGVVKVDEVAADDDQDGQQGITLFRLYAEDANALVMQATQAAVEAHVELRDLHIARPSLEDVFIYLTGRNLR